MSSPSKAPVVWHPTKKQAEFLACGDEEVLYGGAAGGGKTDALIIDVLGLQQGGPLKSKYRGLILRKTYKQLADIVDRSRAIYPKIIPNAKFNATEMEWRFPSGAKVMFGYLDGDSDRYQYQGREFSYIAFEELTQWDSPAAYEWMWTRLRCSDSSIRCLMRATCNPGGAGHAWVKSRWAIPSDGAPTYQEQVIGDRLIRRRFIPSRLADNQHLGSDYRANLMGQPDRERAWLLDGRWDDAVSADKMIDFGPIAAARKASATAVGPKFLGVDPARFGDDSSALVMRQGRVAYGLTRYSKLSTMELVAKVVEAMTKHKPDAVLVDEGGIGSGVFDRLAELGHRNVYGVNFGSRALDADRYVNRRAEMWSLMAEWMSQGGVRIPDDDVLAADLGAPAYGYDSSNRIKLESKDDMRKRGIKSPDAADALALTFALPVSASFKAAANIDVGHRRVGSIGGY